MKDRLFAYTAAVEEYHPKELVSYSKRAESAGFDEIWISDHFHPWVHTGSHSGNAWVILSEIAALTSRVSLGTCVTAPILRYNPAVVAQVFATLESLNTGRVFLGLGLGEAINEIPLGYEWPPFRERLKMLEEAVSVIRALWSKDYVTFKGKYFRLLKANIFDKPSRKIPIYVAAGGKKVAELAGRLADGLFTVPLHQEGDMKALISTFESGVKSSGRDPDDAQKAILIHVAFGEDMDQVIRAIAPWRATLLPFLFDLPVYDPRYIERHGEFVGLEALRKGFLMATSAEEVIKRCEEYFRLGFTKIGFAPSGATMQFMDAFQEEINPYFKS
jgi:G6PDH family F420-dependent oxidoreductase